MSLSSSSRGRRSALVVVFVASATLVGGFLLWGALRQGPAPQISLTSERPAVGAAPVRVSAHFVESARGVGTVTLEFVQGDHSAILAERKFTRPGSYAVFTHAGTSEATLDGVIDRSALPWLQEGDATLRARANRASGALRSAAEVAVEQRLVVRFRPPRLEVLSQQHYVRQGGSGAILLRVGDTTARAGVRAGTWESLAWSRPGGAANERVGLFAVPWDLADGAGIRAFAEDDAGNRIEVPFLTLYRPVPPRHDVIDLSDAFLGRVVPAIAAETTGFDASGTPLDGYLRINGALRRDTLAQIRKLAGASEGRVRFAGPFLQMPNSQRRAGFAETRTYRYQGRAVDTQTHLGLDLASREHAPVPAANSGTVSFAGFLSIYGNAVIIDHGLGLATLYGHMSRLDVTAGQVVAKGAILGATGMTGLAGGDHLHFEVFIQGHSVDPIEWLDAHWIRDNIASKIPIPGV